MEKNRIVFFDSGVGGITLLKEFLTRCPSAPCAYFGDNENAPYGNRAEGEIRRLAENAFGRIALLSPRAAVIACNTVTAECADALRKKYSFPIVGIEPAVRPAAAAVGKGRILLLATHATLASARVRELIRKNCGQCTIVPHCPALLAGEIERNIFDLSRIRLETHIPRGGYAAVVLGCTHYIFLRERIGEFCRCPVFDGNAGTADHLANIVNICSKNMSEISKNPPIFLGNGAKINEAIYYSMR